MSDSAIHVQDLGKRYRIGALQPRNRTLRELAIDKLAVSPRRLRSLVRRISSGENGRPREDAEHIWALRNVSFEVKRGEVMGIIGRNGAGKSTLLRILSRITKPTEGRARINGRVGSLLEVGTGFHPELTGRENIYLSGAILGMKKAEMDRQFEEIVDFSGVEKFVDTSVKRYSSGMQVRLGFAVAAHLEPEVLLVDEVLAVGDVGFQRKCLGKMRDVSGQGRTILFVSHNMGAIKSLCDRCILLKGGTVEMTGPSAEIASYYLTLFNETMNDRRLESITADRGRGEGFVLWHKKNGGQVVANCGEPIVIEFDIMCPRELSEITAGIKVVNAQAEPVVSMSSKVQNVRSEVGPSRTWQVHCNMGKLPINAGRYTADVYVGDGVRDVARFSNAIEIRILEHDVFGWGNRLPSVEAWGPMYWAPEWDIHPSH